MTPFKMSLCAITSAALIALASLGVYVSAQSAEPKEKLIRITAKKFDYSPGEVRLKKGEPVILELRSEDILMGFNLPDFNVREDIVPGKVTRLRLTPAKTGTFVFLCDIFCGSGHEEMNGRLVVTD